MRSRRLSTGSVSFLNYISLQDWINKWISNIGLRLNMSTLRHWSPEQAATQLIGISQYRQFKPKPRDSTCISAVKKESRCAYIGKICCSYLENVKNRENID